MSYCLNPNCHQPQNSHGEKICQSCGSKLLLKDRYRSISFLDSGGMSRNFLGIDTDMPEDKRCVIKQFFPAPQVLDDVEAFEKAIELFQREGAQLDRLGNESNQIPQLFAYLEQERRFYLIQEFIDGQNLLKELDKNGAYSQAQVRKLLDDLLPILQFVHDRGVIHRDIKPENIMRRDNGELVLIDFGMSKHLNSTVMSRGTTGGTMGYAPPEQIRAGVAYPASDIYALGATCIHLLTNITPDRLYDFMSNKWTWREQLVKQERVISDRLANAIDRMLMNEVQDRHQSVSCIVAALADPPVNNWRLPAIICSIVLTLTGTGVAAYINQEKIACAWSMNNKLCPAPIPIPKPQKQKPQKIGDVLYYPYVTTKDKNGASGEFNLAILSDLYEWQLASSDQINLKGQKQSLPISILKQKLKEQGIFNIMDNPNQIIAIGTASCEGSIPEEQNRALNRAKTIQTQIVEPLFRVKNYRMLNLGKSQAKCNRDSADTSFQRSLVIVGMRKNTEGLIVKEALYRRLATTIENLDLNEYSLGDVDNFDLLDLADIKPK